MGFGETCRNNGYISVIFSYIGVVEMQKKGTLEPEPRVNLMQP
jgi:hypothetical protein